MDYLLHVDDSLIVVMVQVSLDLRYSRLSWMRILYLTSFLVASQRLMKGLDHDG